MPISDVTKFIQPNRGFPNLLQNWDFAEDRVPVSMGKRLLIIRFLSAKCDKTHGGLINILHFTSEVESIQSEMYISVISNILYLMYPGTELLSKSILSYLLCTTQLVQKVKCNGRWHKNPSKSPLFPATFASQKWEQPDIYST